MPSGVPKLQENPFFYLNDRGFACEWQKVPSINKKASLRWGGAFNYKEENLGVVVVALKQRCVMYC